MIPKVTVVIKVRYPAQSTVKFIERLCEYGFEDIILLVTNKSQMTAERMGILSERLSFQLIMNDGKREDVALREVLDNIEDSREDIIGVVIVDGNHGYCAEDVMTVARELSGSPDKIVFGCRSDQDSRLLSVKFIYTFFLGNNISDVLTDIKGVPMTCLDAVKETKGVGMAYNTRLFIIMNKYKLEYVTVPVSEDDNGDIIESEIIDFWLILKIYWIVFKKVISFLICSLASTLVDISLFNVVLYFTKGALTKKKSIFLSTIIARVISSLFNYTMNRKTVFASNESVGKSMRRYYILAVSQMLVSSVLVSALTTAIKADNQGMVTVIKMIVDTVLFFISYNIQKKWVFGNKGTAKDIRRI